MKEEEEKEEKEEEEEECRLMALAWPDDVRYFTTFSIFLFTFCYRSSRVHGERERERERERE